MDNRNQGWVVGLSAFTVLLGLASSVNSARAADGIEGGAKSSVSESSGMPAPSSTGPSESNKEQEALKGHKVQAKGPYVKQTGDGGGGGGGPTGAPPGGEVLDVMKGPVTQGTKGK